MISNPPSDFRFSESQMHGAIAQQELFDRAARYCKQRRVCVDVGAHIGLFSRAAFKGGFEKVEAFEPDPENFHCLAQNTADELIFAHDFALGRNTSKCQLKMGQGGNSGCWYAELDKGSIPVMRLDWFHFMRVDLIKIDVEGAEGFVLQGALETLRNNSPVVVFEDNGLGPQHYAEWVDPKHVLASIGYKLAARVKGKNEIWVI